MKVIEYIVHFERLNAKVKKAFTKGITLGLYIGGAIVFILCLLFKHWLP